ncbi:PTS N-acetyl-D-glucosamine transporter [Sphingomonas gilva]|uniref:PTS N-acetyl-D-glucosamine transporter n=1 Tax=Sphingomonas gilva TaxID=2305907 RepID=A0A396RZC4_9SPHN|nr:N-acetylglucosamine-specific PTS transporter subunit IIBC [Sphingomonas gilva]RHW19091.1 PTS N-acetyl-D-glucosamine transporter [Sphingomonas gilva]
MRLSLDRLQPLGRALMLPIAVLPVAALLLRLGQPDIFGIPFVADAGGAIFASLGLLFAIGVAVGLARENHGAAGLAGAVAFVVTVEGAKSLLVVPPEVTAGVAQPIADTLAAAWKTKELAKLSVPAGILSGLVAGWLYNRYHMVKPPEYLAFFGGRRFVPIVAGCAGLVGAVLFGLGFPALEAAIDTLSRWVVSAGGFGLFLYGLLNRLLIVTGLHHILNNIAWFILGDYGAATGDLNRFFAGDPSAGAFMAGFFPVMMFGLPAACLAMYRSAAPERRKGVGGMFLSLALTSFLTGVTEPIEYTFMFLAPVLYLLHAVLTGVSMVVMDALGVKLGFGFSAGLLDYGLNFGLSTRPLMLLPIGAAYFAIYYATFRFFIVRFDLKTPGRDAEAAPERAGPVTSGAAGYVEALGGAANLRTIDACTTRLRLTLEDVGLIDEPLLKRLGARGVVRPGGNALQVVIGPLADTLAGEMRDAVRAAPAPGPDASMIAALGGQANIAACGVAAGRWRIEVADAAAVDARSLDAAASRGWANPSPGIFHILRPGRA